jgi:hypothetical protein
MRKIVFSDRLVPSKSTSNVVMDGTSKQLKAQTEESPLKEVDILSGKSTWYKSFLGAKLKSKRCPVLAYSTRPRQVREVFGRDGFMIGTFCCPTILNCICFCAEQFSSGWRWKHALAAMLLIHSMSLY